MRSVSGAQTQLATPGDRAACRALIRGGSRSFFAASRLLPNRVREPAFALYAFCRLADDEVDEGEGRASAIARLQERLEQAYAGRPLDLPVDRAFADMVAASELPKALPQALLEGLAWDAEGRSYETPDALYAYAARVAGSVGAMMTVLMGRRDAETLARACDLGVAMQLTNIARDVGQDARAGRLYLPRRWLREVGLEADGFLQAPVFSAPLAHVVRRLLDDADRLYVRAEPGVARLPRDCRGGIMAARWIYAEIGREVERAGCDSVSRRAVVSSARKAALLARAAVSAAIARPQTTAPALPQTEYLVAAAACGGDATQGGTMRSLNEQVEWLVDLFTRLEARDRARATGETV